VELSFGGKPVFLKGEEIPIRVKVSNPTATKLRFMPVGVPGHSFFDVNIILTKGGERVQPFEPVTDGGPWGGGFWDETVVRTLEPGESWQDTYRLLEAKYHRLVPGKYQAVAQYSETHNDFGLATGDTESKVLEFEVRAWKAVTEWPSITITKDKLENDTMAVVVTDAGDSILVRRRAIGEMEPRIRVIRLPSRLVPEETRWTANKDGCYLVTAEGIIHATWLHSQVEVLPLKRLTDK